MSGLLEPTTTARAGAVVRLPPGSRDILPEEARELRALDAALQGVFDGAGYGEVVTPTLEYVDVLARGIIGEPFPSLRLVDDRGAWLELRPDMTVPLARVAATRYGPEDGPLRFWYSQAVHRPVPALQGRPREVMQTGVELFGVEGHEGDREILQLAAAALDAVDLPDARLIVGDARLSGTILAQAGFDDETSAQAQQALARGELVALERILASARGGDASDVVRILRTTGTTDVLDKHAKHVGEPGQDLHDSLGGLKPEARARVIVDLGLVRDPDYYSGMTFSVVHPAVGEAIGGGGRYDGLVARFGEPRPAVGFALAIDGVHRAQTGSR